MNTVNAYKTPTGTWVLETPNQSYSQRVFLVNGREEIIPYNQNIESEDRPESLKSVSYRDVVSYYENHYKNQLSVAEYEESISVLRGPSKYIEEDNEYKWSSLDDEFAYRKFVNEWKPVLVKETIYDEYTIIYKELPVSKYKFIAPLYQIGTKAISNPHCVYTPPLKDMIREAAKKYGFEEVSDDPSLHNTLGKKYSIDSFIKYLKVNNQYPITNKEGFFYGTTDTYDKCLEKYSSHVEFFDQLFAQQARIVDNVVLTGNEREMILKSLISIKDKLCKVDPKNKTCNDYYSALEETENLIKKI